MQTAGRRVSLAITVPVPRHRLEPGPVSGTLSAPTGQVRAAATDPHRSDSVGTTSTSG